MNENTRANILIYIDASVRTSTRSREILILIIVVSVLVFGTFWNSRQSSWINDRIDTLQSVRGVLRERDALSKPVVGGAAGVVVAKDAPKPDYQKARRYLEAHPYMNDLGAVEALLGRLQNIQTEHVVYLWMPFFGLLMDVNDLGILGGFTFVVLLFWFRSSLWHERQNLQTTFEAASLETEIADRAFYYRILSMQQLLTTPQPLQLVHVDRKGGRNAAHTDHWKIVVRALLVLPAVVHFTVVAHDMSTTTLGSSVSTPNTVISLVVSSVFFLIIAFLTVRCWQTLNDIAATWRAAASDARKLRTV